MGKINLVFSYFKKNLGNLNFPKTSFYHLILYLPEWIKYRKSGRSSIIDERPWITFEALDFLKKNVLKPNYKIFEYGSGGSSFFFSKVSSELVSVEHDKTWYEKVINALAQKKITNVNYNLAEPEKLDKPILNPDYSNPTQYLSSDSFFLNNYLFKKYASAIDQFPESYFDIVFVDGRARPSCILHSVSKIKKDGFFILDNSDRGYYIDQLSKELKSFKIIFSKIGPGPYGDDFWGTTIYKKIN